MGNRVRFFLLPMLLFAGCERKADHAQTEHGIADRKEIAKSAAAGKAERAFPPETPTERTSGDPNRFALLIGCGQYPNLDKKYELDGPVNDVLLTRKLLVERFQFPSDNVAILSDESSELPTRANIQRHWQRLADVVRPGTQMFVLMAGHGSQTPQQKDDDKQDFEPDGKDEVFLPRDVGKWNDTVGAVANSITDDQLRKWIQVIHQKGASLWVVIDSCHSGTMTRDMGDGKIRELNPEQALGVPKAAMQKAYERAVEQPGHEPGTESQLVEDESETSPTAPAAEPPEAAAEQATLVALFAAQSMEKAPERELPLLGAERKPHGVLTYALNEALSQAEGKLTYRELVQQVHRKYIDWGYVSGPTPLLEGKGLDYEVLGLESFPDRPRILISGNKRSGWKINAGAISGLTSDSILAVYPVALEANADKPIGHVRVLADGFGAIQAKIESCEYDGMPALGQLAAGMRCQAVYVDLGDQRLRVFVDNATDAGEDIPAGVRGELVTLLDEFAGQQKHLIRAVNDLADADWLLRYDSLATKKLFLVPASGWQGQDQGKLPPLFGPAPAGDDLPIWLAGSLSKIARAQSLLRIAGGVASGGAGSRNLNVELIRYEDDTYTDGKPVKFERGGINFYDGDHIGIRVENTGRTPLDVTVLMIDSSYGITTVFPPSGEINRVYPKATIDETKTQGQITATTWGLEHLVVIAVGGEGDLMDFTFLEQSEISRTRDIGQDTLLEKIFKRALFGVGKTRGFARKKVSNYEIRTISWTTHPDTRPQG